MRMNRLKKKNHNNKVIYYLIAIIALVSIIGVYKSYAIYKLEKKYDILESKIGIYKNSDVVISALVDGKETDTFPTYETNYKVSSIECSNGVVGEWDTTNWRLIIDDMSSTSTKCTVNFDSTKTNEETPVAYSKSDLIALNEEITNTSAKALADYLYPVGSIYTSTTDDTVDKVKERFGGTWVRYAEGTMLLSANSTYPVNSTGGNSSVSLSTANLPNHTHNLTPNGSVSSSFSGTSTPTTTNGNHSHVLTGPAGHRYGITMNEGTVQSTGVNFVIAADRINNTSYYGQMVTTADGNHYHTVTAAGTVSSKFTGSSTTTSSCNSCSGTAVNIQNPYTSVYMYKRTA